MSRFSLLLGCVASAIAVLPGCGPSSDGGPPRVPVTVTITHAGSPVEGANITFVPKGEEQAAYGVTDATGKAVLSTMGENDGAMPGSYQVLVRKTVTEGASGGTESTEVGAMPAAGGAAMSSAKTQNLLPEKYSSIGTTDLEATVASEGEVTLSFDLVD